MPEENCDQSKPDMGVKLGHWPGKYSWPDTDRQHRTDSRTVLHILADEVDVVWTVRQTL